MMMMMVQLQTDISKLVLVYRLLQGMGQTLFMAL